MRTYFLIPILFTLFLLPNSARSEITICSESVKDSIFLNTYDEKKQVILQEGTRIQLILPKQPNPICILKGIRNDSLLFEKGKVAYSKDLASIKTIRVFNQQPFVEMAGNTVSFVGKQGLVVSGADLLLATIYSIDKGFELRSFRHVPYTLIGGLGLLKLGNRMQFKAYRLHKRWYVSATGLDLSQPL